MAHIATNTHRPAKTASGFSFSTIAKWFKISRQRRKLNTLDPHILHDIGISQREAKTEARRPFWDAPAHWRN